MLFDFGYTAYLGNVIVRPEYQKQESGRQIVEILFQRTMGAAHEGELVMFILGAAKDKESFYENWAFTGALMNSPAMACQCGHEAG